MTEQENIQVARAFLEAFNAGDWARVKASLVPDSVYEELGTQRRIEGSDAIMEAYRGWKTAMPDARGNVRNAFSGGNSVALEVVWEGTQTGPLQTPGGTIPASGKKQTTPGVFTVEVEGGKIKSSRNYFDMLTFLQQIGAAPA
jgi:steroid delta-isomerase-like uncharacterized protein